MDECPILKDWAVHPLSYHLKNTVDAGPHSNKKKTLFSERSPEKH